MLPTLLQRVHGLLVRETSGRALIPHIDGLRFVAVAVVVMFHLNGYVGHKITHVVNGMQSLVDNPTWRVFASGYFGVRLFFVISGFILGAPFARAWLNKQPKPGLGKYFLRRLTRLEPPYIICMCAISLSAYLMFSPPLGDLIKHLVATLFYSHYFVFGEPSTIHYVSWSLEIEVQFYLLAPLLACVFAIQQKWVRRAMLVLTMAGFAVGQRWSAIPVEHGYTLLNELQYFLCGFLLADFWLVEWQEQAKAWAARAWDIAGGAAWGLMLVTLAWWTPMLPREGHLEPFPIHAGLNHALLVALIFVAYAAAFRGKFWNWLFSQPVLYIIGGMCYTIYLWHFPLISLLGRGVNRVVRTDSHELNLLLSTLIVVPILLVICSVLFVLFEKPFMKPDWVQRVVAVVRGKSRA